jgi:hypothetical protein
MNSLNLLQLRSAVAVPFPFLVKGIAHVKSGDFFLHGTLKVLVYCLVELDISCTMMHGSFTLFNEF